MATLPTPIRAALGLAATAIDEARRLPETLPQLPVTVIGTAMQASLRVQQHIAEYASRGDQLLSQLRGGSDEPPSWATFDDQTPGGNGPAGKAAFELVQETEAEDDDLAASSADLTGSSEAASVEVETTGTAKATRATATKATATKAAPTQNAPSGPAAAKKAAAKKAPAAKSATRSKDPARVKVSEPLEAAAERAEPGDAPNPSVLAAEILQAHRTESD